MSTELVKVEINQILQQMPEESLVSILEYLRAAQTSTTQKVTLTKNFNQILREDRNLLKRLAQ